MIIFSSLVISFFIVCLINFGAQYRRNHAMTINLISIIQQMEMHSGLNPDGMRPEDHAQLGALIKQAEKLAEKTEKILIILLAKKMSNVYDSLKVKGADK